MSWKTLISLIITLLVVSSCARMVEKGVNKVKYSALEKVGVEKRDLFKRNVSNVKEEQEESGEAFKDALTRMKEMYNIDGGKLEKQHSRFADSYQDAQEEAAEVSESIRKLDTVANDLFDEWDDEIGEIETRDLKDRSKKQLRMTKARYEKLHAQLEQSEAKMQPVLKRFKDQVLFLKHNLNAQAIGGLKSETTRIQNDIERLMKEMNQSSKEADELIKTL